MNQVKTILRVALGGCFILSGVMKAVNVYAFAQEIRLYIEAYMDTALVPWAVELAVAVCAMETITGLLALRKRHVPVVAVVFFGMMSFFVWLTGVNLFCPSLMGSIESCGCFGELVHFSPTGSFVKSVVLWVMAAGLLGLCLGEKRGMAVEGALMDGKAVAMAVGGALPAVYSYLCLERMEHGWYLAGYVALCVAVLVLLGGGYVCRK